MFSLQHDYIDEDDDPFFSKKDYAYAHGTGVAGIIGMEKNNHVCGIGVAYNSFITGIAMCNVLAVHRKSYYHLTCRAATSV